MTCVWLIVLPICSNVWPRRCRQKNKYYSQSVAKNSCHWSLQSVAAVLVRSHNDSKARLKEKDCNHSSNGCHPITTAWALYDQGNVWPRNAPEPGEGKAAAIGWHPFDSCHPITTAWPLYDQGNVWHPVTAKILGVRPISSWSWLSGDLKVNTSLIRIAPAQPVGMYGQGTWQGGNALRELHAMSPGNSIPVTHLLISMFGHWHKFSKSLPQDMAKVGPFGHVFWNCQW